EAEVAEERRLFFVGITRARSRLFLFPRRRRTVRGEGGETAPPRLPVPPPRRGGGSAPLALPCRHRGGAPRPAGGAGPCAPAPRAAPPAVDQAGNVSNSYSPFAPLPAPLSHTA